jgi:hypothetical protein
MPAGRNWPRCCRSTGRNWRSIKDKMPLDVDLAAYQRKRTPAPAVRHPAQVRRPGRLLRRHHRDQPPLPSTLSCKMDVIFLPEAPRRRNRPAADRHHQGRTEAARRRRSGSWDRRTTSPSRPCSSRAVSSPARPTSANGLETSMRDLRRDPCRAEARHHGSLQRGRRRDHHGRRGGRLRGDRGPCGGQGGRQAGRGAERAIGVQKDMFDTIRGDLGPTGTSAAMRCRACSGSSPAIRPRSRPSSRHAGLPVHPHPRPEGCPERRGGSRARRLRSGPEGSGHLRDRVGRLDLRAQFNRMLDAARLGESAGAQTGTFGTPRPRASPNLIGAGNAGGRGHHRRGQRHQRRPERDLATPSS